MLERFFAKKQEPSKNLAVEAQLESLDPNIRYGMYKNLCVGEIKYIDNKIPGKRQHMLISSMEMTNIKDGLHQATMNRHLFIPDNYTVTRDMIGQWCLYGYYVWSNRVPGTGEDIRYLNILTLRHFQLLNDRSEAEAVAIEIMDSITQIDFLTLNKNK